MAVVEKTGASELHQALSADDALDVSRRDAAAANNELRTGKVSLVVEPGTIPTFRFDPTRPESRVARLEVEAALDHAAHRPAPLLKQDQPVTQEGSRYIDFLVPGLIGMNLLSAAMFGIGWTMVEARGRKLLKRLAATPMPRSAYLGSYILGHLVLSTAMLVFVIAFARLAFGVHVFGSYLAVLFISLFGAASFAGLSVLCATRTENSEVYAGMSNAITLPMFVASGVFFSSGHFPDLIQPVIQLLPLTAFIDALRAVMTDGATLVSQWPRLLVLTVWGVLSFVLALRWFRWN